MSFLAQIHRATHSDFSVTPAAALPDLEAARADGFAEGTKRMTGRYQVVRADSFISSDLDRLAAALEMVANTSLTVDQIRAKVQSSKELAARGAEALWAPRPEGAADPLAAVDQTGKGVADSGWSRVTASMPTDDGAVASGGPAPAHPSSFME